MKQYLCAFFCTFLFGIAPSRSWAVQATLVGDAHVSSARPTVNSGSLSNLNVGAGFMALVQFDLGTLPSGTTSTQITRATLRLYCNRADTPGNVSLQPLNAAWSESSVTYSTLPASGSATTSAAVSGPDQFVSFDVTSAVQSWVNNQAGNFGFALSADTASVQFDSKENDQTGHAPELDITLAAGTTVAGPSGPIGATGPAGSQGSIGPIGPPGAKGDSGAQGLTGATGPIGPQGVPGSQGPIGLTGATGPQGPAGTQGVAGSQGPIGPIGPAGAKGDTGAQGAAGAGGSAGPMGLTGATGPQGPQGTPGAPGPQGATGSAGDIGPQGPKGDTGAQGATGAAGPAGPAGQAGMNFRAAWNNLTHYSLNDSVTFNGSTYLAFIDNTNQQPDAAPQVWTVIAQSGGAGPTGPAGSDGAAATISVGTVTTLASGSQATVTNSGTPQAAVLNFGIPQGTAGSGGTSTSSSSGNGVISFYHSVNFNSNYYSVSSSAASMNETIDDMIWVPKACIATRLDVFSKQSGSITVTLRNGGGTPASMTDTLSCSPLTGASCSVTGTYAIPAGSFIDFRVDHSSGTAAGVWTALECDPS